MDDEKKKPLEEAPEDYEELSKPPGFLYIRAAKGKKGD
jgi:hypothetical protein